MLNGDGLRTVLWVSGCEQHCYSCQNPQTWDFDSGIPFTEETLSEITDCLSKPYISGLTLSGGHPLERQNLDTVYKVVQKVKQLFPNKTIWLYTGFTWEEILENESERDKHETNGTSPLDIIRHCDVLVDGKYEHEKRDVKLAWRGSSNQRVIDIQKSLKQNKIILWCD